MMVPFFELKVDSFVLILNLFLDFTATKVVYDKIKRMFFSNFYMYFNKTNYNNMIIRYVLITF